MNAYYTYSSMISAIEQAYKRSPSGNCKATENRKIDF